MFAVQKTHTALKMVSCRSTRGILSTVHCWQHSSENAGRLKASSGARNGSQSARNEADAILLATTARLLPPFSAKRHNRLYTRRSQKSSWYTKAREGGHVPLAVAKGERGDCCRLATALPLALSSRCTASRSAPLPSFMMTSPPPSNRAPQERDWGRSKLVS